MFCNKCGSQIEDGAAFCHKCGAKVVSADTQLNQPGETNTESGAQTAAAIPISEGVPAAEPVTGNKSAADEPPSKFDIWWDNAKTWQKVLVGVGFIAGCVIALELFKAFLDSFGEVLFILILILALVGLIIMIFKGTDEEKKEARNAFFKVAAGIVAFTLVVVIIVAIAVDSIPGEEVRNSYLTQYSDEVTVGEAFDSYFDKPKWSTYEENGYTYVAFTGVCEYLGERSDVRITFKITGERFNVDSLEVNGQEMNDLVLFGLLTAVYDEYE